MTGLCAAAVYRIHAHVVAVTGREVCIGDEGKFVESRIIHQIAVSKSASVTRYEDVCEVVEAGASEAGQGPKESANIDVLVEFVNCQKRECPATRKDRGSSLGGARISGDEIEKLSVYVKGLIFTTRNSAFIRRPSQSTYEWWWPGCEMCLSSMIGYCDYFTA